MAKALQKRSYEERRLTLQLHPALGGDTIKTVKSITITPVTSGSTDVTVQTDSIRNTETEVSFLAEDGEAGQDYSVVVRVTTNSTPEQLLEATGKIEVRDG